MTFGTKTLKNVEIEKELKDLDGCTPVRMPHIYKISRKTPVCKKIGQKTLTGI
jgi:hypothetical protein